MAEILGGAAMVFGGLNNLWDYNRANWQFDEAQRQNREHQVQNMRVQQASLHREDLRDLFGLTISKMDSYMTVNTLQLGFCISLYYDGRLADGCPSWIFWLHAVSLGGAFTYLILSLWFSVYASISAQSYVVRVLTQHVRLPVPTETEIELARAHAAEYEMNWEAALRLPFIAGKKPKGSPEEEPMNTETGTSSKDAPRKAGGDGGVGAARRPGTSLTRNLSSRQLTPAGDASHFALFRQVQADWKGFDSYARVCMALGTYHLFQTLVYFSLAYFMAGYKEDLGSLFYLVIFLTIEYLLVKLELILDPITHTIVVFLIFSGPVLAAAIGIARSKEFADYGIPAVFVLHFAWLAFLLSQVLMTSDINVPTKFRTVAALDIFSWLASTEEELSGSGPEAQGEAQGEAPDLVRARSDEVSLLQNEARLERWLKLWSSEKIHRSHISAAQSQEVHAMFSDFEQLREMRRVAQPHTAEPAPSPPGADEDGWICMFYTSDRGQPMPYWYRPAVDETRWERPDGLNLDPPGLFTLQELFSLYRLSVEAMCSTGRPSLRALSTKSMPRLQSRGPSMLANLGKARSLPHRLFQQSSVVLLFLWAASFLWAVLFSLDLGLDAGIKHEYPHEGRRLLDGLYQRIGWGADTVEEEESVVSRLPPQVQAALKAYQRRAEPVVIDLVGLRLAKACRDYGAASGMALLDHGRSVARRLRKEADMGDGRISHQELLLWLESLASPENICLMDAVSPDQT